MQTTEDYCTCHQLLVEELATASVCHNFPYIKSLSPIFYTKQVLLHQARIQKPKYATVFGK